MATTASRNGTRADQSRRGGRAGTRGPTGSGWAGRGARWTEEERTACRRARRRGAGPVARAGAGAGAGLRANGGLGGVATSAGPLGRAGRSFLWARTPSPTPAAETQPERRAQKFTW